MAVVRQHAHGLRRPGFTLMEASLATIIVGLGVSAAMALLGACTIENKTSGQMTAAMMLASNVQEAMANLPFNDPVRGRSSLGYEAGETVATFNDIDDFDGSTFSPPIDSSRAAVSDLSQYSQVVSVTPVDPNRLTSDLPKTVSNWTAVRVTVRITYKASPTDTAREVYRTSWIRLY